MDRQLWLAARETRLEKTTASNSNFENNQRPVSELRQHLVADNTFITTAISITVSSSYCLEPIVTFARVMV